ncbi:hypothetical protein Bbelb_129160 [Branchiostoma belcheri]|nr:hypothetical protein Bbelb_129160 [Branchiostoma belcheri]
MSVMKAPWFNTSKLSSSPSHDIGPPSPTAGVEDGTERTRDSAAEIGLVTRLLYYDCTIRVASCDVVVERSAVKQGDTGSIPGSVPATCPNMLPGVVSLGKRDKSPTAVVFSWPESSARRAGVIKADLERNQVIRQLAASITTGTSTSRLTWYRWRRRMPKGINRD